MQEKKTTTKPHARPASAASANRSRTATRSTAKTSVSATKTNVATHGSTTGQRTPARRPSPTTRTAQTSRATAVEKVTPRQASASVHSAKTSKAEKAEKEKKKKQAVIIIVVAVVCALVLIGLILGIYFLTRKKPAPAGHYTFREYVGTIGNPGIGYTHTDWYHTALGDTKVHDVQGDVVLFFVDLGPFSAGANGEGVDYDLDASFFAALRGTFENCRKNGSTIAVRFRYDENGRDNPEPNSFAQVLKHIAQIKENGILEDYKDILMFVESGFVGKWGEQHGGKYTSLDYKAELLGAMLDCVPAPVPVTVRTPDIFAKYASINRNELATYECKAGTEEYRVGLYDDGYMGSDSDLGTYANRENETTWLGRQTLTSYFGGEFSGNIEFAKQYSTYLPENCIPEMYKTHLSYINGNIFQLYKDYTYNKAYAVEGIDNSAYYGQTVFQFIRDHLGYRFVLKSSDLSPKVARGGTLDVSFSLVNNGFANPVKAQKSEVLLEKDGKFVRTDSSLDPTKWYSGCSVNETLHLKIPANLAEGKWNVYLKFSTGNTDMTQFAFRSIRFANQDTWNEALGANYIGFFEVSGAAVDETDDTFYEIGQSPQRAQLYSLGGGVTMDGKRTSEAEWTADDLLKEEGGHALYLKADEENLYVMASLPHASGAPVFNLRLTNKDSGVSYWLYVQSSGFVYFNHDSDTGHRGLQLAYGDALFEFKVPLYMFDLTSGTHISSVVVSVQDGAIANWPQTGRITFEGDYTVACDFPVYTVHQRITRRVGGTVTLSVETGATLASVQWLVGGEVLTGQTGLTLTLENIAAADAGAYSVRLTTAAGNEKTVPIAQLSVI